ncbi:hypothetical protein [Castellaniella sp.]|uniref:hypothetical protein n=1 Tax=Castellaniella sp. TaxID=1955812 RepID=UPI002AFDF733|nr:hypothetical protein [Castellaniella sp.]
MADLTYGGQQEVRERPVPLFRHEARAVHLGLQTQFRRPVKDPNGLYASYGQKTIHPAVTEIIDGGDGAFLQRAPERVRQQYISTFPCHALRCPYGVPGDRLWVRESWAHGIHALGAQRDEDGPFVYAADNLGTQGRLGDRWRNGIHMPRWASRTFLEVVNVRVERLQSISETDCIAQGIKQLFEKQGWVTEARFPDGKRHFGAGAYELYRQLWDLTVGPNALYGWERNPFVWVVEFRRIEGA